MAPGEVDVTAVDADPADGAGGPAADAEVMATSEAASPAASVRDKLRAAFGRDMGVTVPTPTRWWGTAT